MKHVKREIEMNITKEDKTVILQMTEQRCAELCNELNSFKVPKKFVKYKDEIGRLRELTHREWELDNILTQLHEFAEDNCSPKLVSWLHCKGLGMTEDEHTDFWAGNYEGNKEAKERHTMRSWKEIATRYEVADQVDWTRDSDNIQKQLEELVG